MGKIFAFIRADEILKKWASAEIGAQKAAKVIFISCGHIEAGSVNFIPISICTLAGAYPQIFENALIYVRKDVSSKFEKTSSTYVHKDTYLHNSKKNGLRIKSCVTFDPGRISGNMCTESQTKVVGKWISVQKLLPG